MKLLTDEKRFKERLKRVVEKRIESCADFWLFGDDNSDWLERYTVEKRLQTIDELMYANDAICKAIDELDFETIDGEEKNLERALGLYN